MEKTIVLDGRCMQNPDAAHSYLKHMLHFPDHYGQNADALYDCLTEIGGMTRLELDHPDAAFPLIRAVLQAAASQNPCLTLQFYSDSASERKENENETEEAL